jgi:hypothetical protein
VASPNIIAPFPLEEGGPSLSLVEWVAYLSSVVSTPTPVGVVTARQWQTALASQSKLDTIREAIPADVNDPIAIQWFACGYVKPPPATDVLWNFTQTTLGYNDAQMLVLYSLAFAQDA